MALAARGDLVHEEARAVPRRPTARASERMGRAVSAAARGGARRAGRPPAGRTCSSSCLQPDAQRAVLPALRDPCAHISAARGRRGSDGAQLLDALREGRSYLSLDFVGDPRGFACWAEGDSAQVLMGEAVNDPGPWTIRVETPARAELRLIHDGARVSATVASRLEHRVDHPARASCRGSWGLQGRSVAVGWGPRPALDRFEPDLSAPCAGRGRGRTSGRVVRLRVMGVPADRLAR
jgi:hypothetical protein